MTHEVTFDTESELDAELRQLSAARGIAYSEALRLVLDHSPAAAEAVERVVNPNERTTLSTDGGPGIELDAAGHALLAPGEDADSLLHDQVAVSREWRAVQAFGEHNPAAG